MVLFTEALVKTSKREVRNYIQALSSVGGLLGIISAFNFVVMHFFTDVLLERDLIAELFFNSNDYKK
jgi:hypothetical protein